MRDRPNVTIAMRSKVKYLPLNGTTVNVVRHNLDFRFQGHKFWNVNILKTVSASENSSCMTFIEFNICHRMGPLRTLIPWPWSKFSRSQGKTFSCYAFAIKKMHRLRMFLADMPQFARLLTGMAPPWSCSRLS